jgi:hypothetical protein
LQDVKKAMNGGLNITWKCFSLDQVNSKEEPDWKIWEQPEDSPSVRALLPFFAGEAAKKQGDEAFEKFHVALLNTRHVDRKRINDVEALVEVAKSVGLDVDKFREDLKDKSTLEKIGADHTEAKEKYGVFGVPTLVTEDGQAAFLKMMPPPPPEEAAQIFDTLLGVVSGRPNILEIKRPELDG